MKVTREEYDAMENEVSSIERTLDTKYKGIDHWETKWHDAKILLEKAEVEKDLSVDVVKPVLEIMPYMLNGKYRNKGYLLPGKFNWDFKLSPGGNKLLVPTEREE